MVRTLLFLITLIKFKKNIFFKNYFLKILLTWLNRSSHHIKLFYETIFVILNTF